MSGVGVRRTTCPEFVTKPLDATDIVDARESSKQQLLKQDKACYITCEAVSDDVEGPARSTSWQ